MVKSKTHTGGLKEFHHSNEKLGDTSSTKAFKDAYRKWKNSKIYKIKFWLNRRYHRKYYNWNAFFMNVLWVVLLSISFLDLLPSFNSLITNLSDASKNYINTQT